MTVDGIVECLAPRDALLAIECRHVRVDEVEILRRGEEVVLRKKRKTLREAFDVLASMPEDFFAEGRQDPPPEVREGL